MILTDEPKIRAESRQMMLSIVNQRAINTIFVMKYNVICGAHNFDSCLNKHVFFFFSKRMIKNDVVPFCKYIVIV